MNTKHKGFKTKVFFWLVLMMISGMSIAQPVSRETARQAAKTFLENNGAQSAELSDVSAAAGFEHLYVFTTGNSFVLMAADSRVQPVLGYSLNGGFDTEGMPENVREWLQGYDDEIQWAIDNNWRAAPATARQWQDLENGVRGPRATTVVAPLIQTRWNQNKYYNNLCPVMSGGPGGHAYTGCTATAMAQIMKYYNYPSKGIGSHSYDWNGQTLSADFGSTTYDWDNMADYYEYYVDDNGSYQWLPTPSSVEIDAVATLMYHCGVSVDMNYTSSGSGASISNAAIALKSYFNYSSTTEYKRKSDFDDTEWDTMVKNELDQSRPLEYAGYDPNGSGGHAFVCDGYNDADYFHFNWGWAGAYDGYFSLANLDTGANNQSGSGNGVYTRNQEAIFGIQPVQCAASAPTNLAYTMTGLQNITLSWTAANGATSYNIYRNNNYVGNSTTTSYSEDTPFGTNAYYVRSVDASGNLSLSSNYVTVYIGYQIPIVDDLQATLSGNNVSLTWTAPEWCYPETPTATLNYGEGPVYYSWTSVYYAHRHLAADLAQYAGKAVYKVSTYIQYPGTYSVYVYTNSNQSNKPDPNSLAFSKTGMQVTVSNDWYEIDMDDPIILTGTNDLWVVMKQENTGQTHPTPSFSISEHNINAFYASSSSPTNLYDANSSYNCAWLINTYLTDGIYTYNLYRDDAVIAEQISETQYTDSALPDGTYAYYVKTNYYGGETEASNTVTVTLPGLATQTVTFTDGWTWWTPTVATSLAQLETALGSNGILINSQDDGFARYENGSWSGTLQGFEPGQMYKIAAQTTDPITLTGLPATSATINILPGYNWFGYTGGGGLTIAEALGDFEPAEGDTIVDEDGNTATYNGSAWTSTLTTLTRGKGYVYHSTVNETKTMTLH